MDAYFSSGDGSHQLPIQEEGSSSIALQRQADHHEGVTPSCYHHQPTPIKHYHQLDIIKTQEEGNMYERHHHRHLPSPEVESQLPSFPPHSISESFMAVMDDTRRHHPRLHMRIIRNAISLLLKTDSQYHYFPLDHCTSKYTVTIINKHSFYI